jgi:hypothetical protein
MKTALLAACAALALFNAVAKDSSPEYRVTEIPMFPDLPPDQIFDPWITALNDRGQMTAIISIVRPDPYHDGEYFLDHYEGRFWDGRKWWHMASGSNDTIAIDVNARGEVLASTDFIKQPMPFERQYTPFVWRRGAVRSLNLAFENTTVSHWNQHADLAGHYYVLEPVYTNISGLVYTSQVSHPFLFRDGTYVDLVGVARGIPHGVIINRRGDALISSGGNIPYQNELGSARLTLLSRRGTNDLPTPPGWNVWPWVMGDDAFAGDFTRPIGSNDWTGGGFFYRNGNLVVLNLTNEIIHIADMNARGDVVGYVADEDYITWPDDVKGFIYRDGERHFIRDLVPRNSDWKLLYPMAINNRGEMAGFGRRGARLTIYLLRPEKQATTKSDAKPLR